MLLAFVLYRVQLKICYKLDTMDTAVWTRAARRRDSARPHIPTCTWRHPLDAHGHTHHERTLASATVRCQYLCICYILDQAYIFHIAPGPSATPVDDAGTIVIGQWCPGHVTAAAAAADLVHFSVHGMVMIMRRKCLEPCRTACWSSEPGMR